MKGGKKPPKNDCLKIRALVWERIDEEQYRHENSYFKEVPQMFLANWASFTSTDVFAVPGSRGDTARARTSLALRRRVWTEALAIRVRKPATHATVFQVRQEMHWNSF